MANYFGCCVSASSVHGHYTYQALMQCRCGGLICGSFHRTMRGWRLSAGAASWCILLSLVAILFTGWLAFLESEGASKRVAVKLPQLSAETNRNQFKRRRIKGDLATWKACPKTIHSDRKLVGVLWHASDVGFEKSPLMICGARRTPACATHMWWCRATHEGFIYTAIHRFVISVCRRKFDFSPRAGWLRWQPIAKHIGARSGVPAFRSSSWYTDWSWLPHCYDKLRASYVSSIHNVICHTQTHTHRHDKFHHIITQQT